MDGNNDGINEAINVYTEPAVGGHYRHHLISSSGQLKDTFVVCLFYSVASYKRLQS